jgi:hypothetical protein
MPDSPDVANTWRILDGPATMETPQGGDWDICWVWLTGRGDERRHVAVYVARGCLGRGDLARESERAIQTRGESVVGEVLGESEAPTRLTITRDGIARR